MSEKQEKALVEQAPIGRSTADSTFGKGAMRAATATTQTTKTIPSAWLNQMVTFQAVTKNTQFCVVRKGDTAPTLTYDQASALDSQSAGAAPTLIAGQSVRLYVPGDAQSLTWISEATGGTFEAWLSTPRNYPPVP